MTRKAQTTKTLNPLPFNDLEPKRFEDLVRQLAYDFRPWRSLEPTGRLGADDGYDARGFEITSFNQPTIEKNDEDDQEETGDFSTDRLWQIQCKREKTVTPAKIKAYADEMVPEGAEVPHGVIFAAPCDFSKKTRDAFREAMRKKGISEVYLWGRADLEDMLFQPKNDNVLFAFFGISLQMRKRSKAAQIKGLLATKRKAVRHLGTMDGKHNQPILIRDSQDELYPYSLDVPDFEKKPHWKKYIFVGHSHDGIRILTRKFIASAEYSHEDGRPSLKSWDFFEGVNLASVHDDRWNNKKDVDSDLEWRAHRYHSMNIEKQNRAYLEIEVVIPYSRIVEIDSLGDGLSRGPHVYIDNFNADLFNVQYWKLTPEGSYGNVHPLRTDEDKLRKKIFPQALPTTEEFDAMQSKQEPEK